MVYSRERRGTTKWGLPNHFSITSMYNFCIMLLHVIHIIVKVVMVCCTVRKVEVQRSGVCSTTKVHTRIPFCIVLVYIEHTIATFEIKPPPLNSNSLKRQCWKNLTFPISLCTFGFIPIRSSSPHSFHCQSIQSI